LLILIFATLSGNKVTLFGTKVESAIDRVCVVFVWIPQIALCGAQLTSTEVSQQLTNQNAQLDVFAKYSNATKLAVADSKISLTFLSRHRGIYCFCERAMRWRCKKIGVSLFHACYRKLNTHWRTAKQPSSTNTLVVDWQNVSKLQETF
jgi:hypothetical protein